MPLQMATITYEVCSNLANKEKIYKKFRGNFKKKVKVLEKNFQKCTDPSIKDYESVYRKNFYELPADYLIPKKFGDGEESEKV